MEEPERFAVVGADAHLEQHAVVGCGFDEGGEVEIAAVGDRADRRLVDDPADLQPADLAEDDAVFDADVGAGVDDQPGEGEVFGIGGGRRRQRLGDGGQQCPFLGEPDRHREAEALGATGEHAGAVIGDEVQLRTSLADRPGERPAECAGGVAVDQHPGRVADDEGGAVGERLRLGRHGDVAEVLGDEGAQLDTEQPAAEVGGVRRGWHRDDGRRPAGFPQDARHR